MFQPRGPKLQRSWIRAWKKKRPKSIFLKDFWQSLLTAPASLNHSSSMPVYARSKLDFRPFGGSTVILLPFWSTLTGNSFEGIADSHNRNSGANFSGSSSSTMASSRGIHDTERWQFCKMTHMPCSLPSLIAASALGPWPWPKEIDAMSLLFSSANLYKVLPGSAPGERMKINGDIELESAYEPERSKGGGLTNFSPSLPAMNSKTAGTTRSGRMQRRTMTSCKALRPSIIFGLVSGSLRIAMGAVAS
mmetsp:Transcript_49832/g.161161  ORF Transcript_49832/g.161161 Transcript_49832/m.161161 type:complete len:248 (+) Transcript_49832:1577-2320(+)